MMIQNQQNSPNFGARLFLSYPMTRVGENIQIKAFLKADRLNNIDVMAKKASPATDIFVTYISKDKSKDKCLRFVVKNPLFEDIKISNVFKTVETDGSGDLETNLKVLDAFTGEATNNCKDLENMAVKGALSTKFFNIVDSILGDIESIPELCKKLADVYNNNELPQGRAILSEMLAKIPQRIHGFSDERIKDFEQIADKLQNDYETFLKEEILPKLETFLKEEFLPKV